MNSVLLADNEPRYLIVEDDRVFQVNTPCLESRLVFRVADAIQREISDQEINDAFTQFHLNFPPYKKIKKEDLNYLERLVSQVFYRRIVLPSLDGHCRMEEVQGGKAFWIDPLWMKQKWDQNLSALVLWDSNLSTYQIQYKQQIEIAKKIESTPLCSFGDIFFSCGAKIKKLWNAFCEAFILFWTWTKSSKQAEEKKQEFQKVCDALIKSKNALGKAKNALDRAENPSAVTENPSAVTENPSAVTENPSAVTENPSAVTENPSAVTENPSAVTENPSAVTENALAEAINNASNCVREFKNLASQCRFEQNRKFVEQQSKFILESLNNLRQREAFLQECNT